MSRAISSAWPRTPSRRSPLPYRLDEAFVEIGCSVGLAAYPDGEDVEALLQFADEAMYRAKARGAACGAAEPAASGQRRRAPR